MKTITCPSKEVPVIAETQVLVVGSGPCGYFCSCCQRSLRGKNHAC